MIRRFLRPLALGGAALLAGGVLAQIEGTRGVAPVDSSGTFEVDGVSVDVAAPNAEQARYAGWRLAQRKAWATLAQRLGSSAGAASDGTLDGIVSGIVVENEQIGPTRYIARLGVLFDRARAASLLGISAYASRSPPMLVIPVIWSEGVGAVFEQRTPWQEAWARFRTGGSAVNYVRPSGGGVDSLLLTVGQTERRGRAWWRMLIGAYGASDVLIPQVRLTRQWPGGPIVGEFEARHGPDNDLLQRFSLRVGSSDGLPQLLDEGVRRLDAIYAAALAGGELRPDQALAPKETPTPDADTDADSIATDDTLDASGPVTTVSIQYDTPGAGAVTATEAVVRALPGVKAAITASLALGGTSVMRVEFGGDPELLRSELADRGFQVFGSGASLRIRRAPQLLPPELSPDNAAAG